MSKQSWSYMLNEKFKVKVYQDWDPVWPVAPKRNSAGTEVVFASMTTAAGGQIRNWQDSLTRGKTCCLPDCVMRFLLSFIHRALCLLRSQWFTGRFWQTEPTKFVRKHSGREQIMRNVGAGKTGQTFCKNGHDGLCMSTGACKIGQDGLISPGCLQELAGLTKSDCRSGQEQDWGERKVPCLHSHTGIISSPWFKRKSFMVHDYSHCTSLHFKLAPLSVLIDADFRTTDPGFEQRKLLPVLKI